MRSFIELNIAVDSMVVVLNNPNNDNTFNRSYVGMKRKVKYFDFKCGCGQSYPNDPMIGIEFSNGEIEEYWKEEIKRL